MQGKEWIPITPEGVKALGWETLDNVAFVLPVLDDKRFIDLFYVDGEWAFDLREESTVKGEDVAIFTGRKVSFLFELEDLYFGLTGVRLT